MGGNVIWMVQRRKNSWECLKFSDIYYLPAFPSWFWKYLGQKKIYRGNMAVLLFCITLLHVLTLGVLFIATMGKPWWVWNSTERSDLWYNCRLYNETETWFCVTSKETEWLQAVQVLMILSAVFCSISFFIFIGQLFIMSKGGLFYITGVCQTFAGLTTFTAVLIYTLHNKEILQDSKKLHSGHFGYCFILAWVCVALLLCSGIMYIYLRKRE